MTTYEELWNDINFIERRILEQEFYYVRLEGRRSFLTPERFQELLESCMYVMNKFDARLTELIHASKTN